MDTIFVYTEDQAINDGLLIKLASDIVMTSNFAHTVAPADGGFDLGHLWDSLLPKVTAYRAGIFFDAGATDYPDECDEGLACYLINGHKVWIMPSWPGSRQITVMLPEDY